MKKERSPLMPDSGYEFTEAAAVDQEIKGDEKEIAPDAKIPASVDMMGKILFETLIEAYGVAQDDIHFSIVMFDDESFAYHYRSAHVGKDCDAYEDPDFYDAVSRMLSDLKAETSIESVHVCTETLYVEVVSKLALWKAIKNLTIENGLNSTDSVVFENPEDDHGCPSQRVMEMMRENSRKIKEALASDRRLNASLFGSAEASPSMSMDHYHAALMRPHHAELTVSLDHIYKTILQEDKIDAVDPRADRVKFGGMN